MGFFKSKKDAAQPKIVRPIVVQPADLPAFSARLAAVEAAMGGPDAPLRSAVRALSESVGGVDPWNIIKLGLDSDEIKRPWRWFARACEVANEQGDYGIAPRVFLFMDWWKGLHGKLQLADYSDMWLDPVPADAESAISAAAADAVSRLPDDQTLIENANLLIRVGGIRGAVVAAAGAV